ncbi:MAG: NAD(P)H-dependent oxidoreductase [Deinococcota bacterium]
MKALVLDGMPADASPKHAQLLQESLEAHDYEVTHVALHKLNVAYCQGCFECWTASPGVCKINDGANDVTQDIVVSDLLVYLTPVTFGGYSYHLKKMIDRMACSLLLPFFQHIQGKTHHVTRYQKLPDLLGVGVLPEADVHEEALFSQLVSANARNLHATHHAATTLNLNLSDATRQARLQWALESLEDAA